MLSIQELGKAFSRERLAAYSLDRDSDSTDALARYLWNGHLCASFQPALHVLEVSLRNAIFDASEPFVVTRGRNIGSVRCWLDVKPSLLDLNKAKAVEEAKRRLGHRRYHTPGRLISKLSFGFWVGLFHRPYDHGKAPGLWPTLLPVVFPNLPSKKRHRQEVFNHLEKIRNFRNRIAHHEPIWDRDLLVHHAEILEVIGWLSAPMQLAAEAYENPIVILNAGYAAYRHAAKQLLGI